MVAVTFIATSAGILITPATLVIMAVLTIWQQPRGRHYSGGTTMIFTIMAGLGFTTEACLVGYAGRRDQPLRSRCRSSR